MFLSSTQSISCCLVYLPSSHPTPSHLSVVVVIVSVVSVSCHVIHKSQELHTFLLCKTPLV
jgi:hypothetical protein